MNAVPRSVLPQQHLSRRPAANSREMRSRVAFSPTVTSMPSRTAGQKIERLNTDARLRKPNPWDPTTSRLAKGAATLAGNSGTLPVSVAPSSMRKGQKLSTAGRSERTATLPLSPRPEPIWLSSLLFLQRSSDLITFLLIAATLTIYSWTVYTQQQWTREYRKLETLQRQERQMTTANAAIKDQLAQQAESTATGLVTPTPANTIFLPPAPQRSSHTAPTKTADSQPAATTPLGY
jgi:hypothetical protein